MRLEVAGRATRLAVALATLFATLLTACVPAPRIPLATVRARAPAFATVRTALTHAGLHAGAWPATRWWRIFHDPELTALIHQGLAASGSIRVALAHVRAAHAAYRLAAARTGPSVNATGSVQHEHASATGLIPPPFAGNTFNYGTIGLNAHYDLAFWDRQHVALKAALGAEHAATAEAAEVRLIVSTEIAERYWSLASAANRVREDDALLRVRRRMQFLLKTRFDAGITSAIRRENGSSLLAVARAQASAARATLLKTRFALAALLGRGPRFAATVPLPHVQTLPSVYFPRHIGLDLVARRPDIQVRYWQVRQAAVGREAARARYYPNLSLDATLGYQSIALASLINPANLATAVGPAINLPLFGSGARRADLSESRARFDAAVARYNATIIHAANHVAYALLALAAARHQWQDANAQAGSAARAYALICARQKAGIIGALPARAARLTVLNADHIENQARMRVLSAEVAVIKSLGGGYHTQTPIPESTKP
ncbi:MAG: efflux transporter outer membrane subunit [Acidiferrobacter sp.]